VTKTLRVRATRLRPSREHGCEGTCGKTPGFCPRRRQRNGVTGAIKSAAGDRIVRLPDEPVILLEECRRKQRAAHPSRVAVSEGGWVLADGHADHGLVEHIHGSSLPTRHRPDPA
jgi:integrase